MAIVFNPLTSSFDYTGSTSGNTVMPYANLAAFPSAVTAGNGALAEALDTHIIYASNGAAWVAIAGPGAVLSVGAFGSSPNANALSIIADVLYAQPASASFPGGVSTTTQTFAGDKTLSGATTLQQDLTFDTASQATIKTKNSSTATTQPMYLSSGYGTNHPSGAVAMLSGPSNQNTGDVSVYSSPPAAANNYSGVANVYTGSASGTGYSGAVNIYSGDTANAPSGNISISSGLASANSSGNITLTVGTATGTRGHITLDSNYTGIAAASAVRFYNAGNINYTALVAPTAPTGVTFKLPAADGSSGQAIVTDSSGNLSFASFAPTGSYITALTGDATATGPGSVALTLATVNANVGSFGTATQTSTFTVNAKGLITAASNTSIQIAESQVTNLVSDLAGKQAGPLTGDVTTSGAASTLATVNTNVGSFGSSTSIPTFTVNAKGLITAASGNVVIAPAGTLSGATLNATVVSSSLTSVGTITSGTWTGTTIAVANGGTGITTTPTAGQLLVGNAGNTGYADVSVSGDATLASTGALTLSTVNANVGSFGTTTQVSTFTVNAKGLITAASNTAIQITESQVTNLTTDLAAKQVGPLSGDISTSAANSAVTTLATVNANVGSFGSSTSIPTFTVNAKGLITAASGNVVIAPAGTLTGTTLASNVVTSSLTSVGTITTGTWTGTTIAVANGGTNLTSGTSGGILGYTASGVLASSAALTINQLIIGGGAGATPSTLTAGSQYQVLRMGATTPAYGSINLDQAAAVTGVLPLANGGTGFAAAGAAILPAWVKYTVSHTSLQAAALVNDIELFQLAAKQCLHAVMIKHSTAFSGGAIATYTLSVGLSGTLTKYTSAFDVFQATGNTVLQTSNSVNVENTAATTSVRLSAISTGANLNASAAGSVDVYVMLSTLP